MCTAYLQLTISFSTELSDLHEHIMSLEARRDALQERLRTELEAPTLELGVNKRGSFVVNVKKKTQLGRLERSGKFHTLTETLSSKSFAYSVSLSCGYFAPG